MKVLSNSDMRVSSNIARLSATNSCVSRAQPAIKKRKKKIAIDFISYSDAYKLIK
jgi:hypothetical protein